MRIIMLLLSAFFVVHNAWALTLDEAVQSALESDDSIKQSYYMLESKKYSSRSSWAAFMPKVDLNYTYSDSRLHFKSMPYVDAKSSNLNFQAGFNVFNGLNDMRNIQMSGKAYEVQGFVYNSKIQDIILETKNAYLGYLKANKNLGVAEETVTLLETQKNIAEVSYNVGQFSKSDVLRVDVQLASSQLDYINAQINLKLARQQLEKLIGRVLQDDEIILEIEVKDSYNIPELEILYAMIETQSDMMGVKGGYEISRLDKLKAAGGYLPNVSVGYIKGWQGANMNPLNKIEGMGNNDYYRSDTLSLTASWNIFSGLYNYHDYMSKSAAAESSAFSVSDTRKGMRLQLSGYYENYFSAKKRLAVAKVAVEQARESYRVTESQYANSEATTTDVLSASIALNSALNSFSAANYDVMMAVAQIERVTGENLLGLDY